MYYGAKRQNKTTTGPCCTCIGRRRNKGRLFIWCTGFSDGKNLYVTDVIGVSAGACNAVDYVSEQIGRTRDCMIHKEKELDYYLGIRKMFKEKSMLDMDLIFDKYPNELIPFDYDTYFDSDINCEIVTTNCETGKAEYMTERKDRDRLMKIGRASSSMPLAAPIVRIDGVPYLDGGLADSVPIQRAMKKDARRSSSSLHGTKDTERNSLP